MWRVGSRSPRNVTPAHMHGFLSLDGTVTRPARLLRPAGRRPGQVIVAAMALHTDLTGVVR